MSVKKVEQIKNGKLFRVWDLIVYAFIAVVAVALILVFTLTGDNTALSGVGVSYKGKEVFSYDFANGKYAIADGEMIEVESDGKEFLTVIFRAEGGYNKIELDKKGKSVRVSATDCSSHKDCLYTKALTANGSVPIICAPHSLSVYPLVFIDDGVIN